ncbi:MAG: M20/M25/M40 family metallo-hydrolase [Deltaproteobacteria bacterium]|nr:MAG: M20/M25/M40 family metallo-hydrolase [Deltaproteobacteria bacterium]
MKADTLDIDWRSVRDEATELLRQYIRIDTTNPPGGEQAGAEFLRERLDADGIASTLYEAAPGRVSIAARLPRVVASELRPIVLLSHIDVVPAEPEHWQVDPFAGELIDGVIWGRGALDMKGMAVMELLATVLAKRLDLPLERDIVFLAVADEEEGGEFGIRYLAREHPELLEADVVLNEGAYGFREFMGRPVKMFAVGPSEKSPCWLRLVARGRPGHASVPHGDNAVERLVAALARISAAERRKRVSAPVEAMLRTLATEGFLPADLDPTAEEVVEMLASADGHLAAVTSDTINLTSLRAGGKHNVIPASAEATLDCRLLPGTNPDEFVAELERLIDDSSIEIVRVLEHVSGESSLDAPPVAAIRDVVAATYGEDGMVLPVLSPGFTDSHAFRAAGVPAYGFIPALLTREELATIHGHNERISQENLELGTRILFEVVRRLACPRAWEATR